MKKRTPFGKIGRDWSSLGDCSNLPIQKLELSRRITMSTLLHRLYRLINRPLVHIALAFIAGTIAGYVLLLYFLVSSVQPDPGQFTEINPIYLETDVSGLITLHNDEDVTVRRNELIHYIWGDEGFPSEAPEVVENIVDERYAGLRNLKEIHKLTINMEWGLVSIAYHFVPTKSNNQLIVYHQGHRGDFIAGINVIQAFLDEGYSVVGMAMPLMGLNNQPVVDLNRFGRLKLTSHDHLAFLDFKNGHPIKLFVYPVAVVVNYAHQYGYQAVHMVGISGGGWTTTLSAALDPRLSHSYPVAGSLPNYLRSEFPGDSGDYEQVLPELYRIANYPELYILGSYGRGRKQLQVLNQYDSCCFAGVRYKTYESIIQERLSALGEGSFAVFLDTTHREHIISNKALEVIINDLTGENS